MSPSRDGTFQYGSVKLLDEPATFDVVMMDPVPQTWDRRKWFLSHELDTIPQTLSDLDEWMRKNGYGEAIQNRRLRIKWRGKDTRPKVGRWKTTVHPKCYTNDNGTAVTFVAFKMVEVPDETEETDDGYALSDDSPRKVIYNGRRKLFVGQTFNYTPKDYVLTITAVRDDPLVQQMKEVEELIGHKIYREYTWKGTKRLSIPCQVTSFIRGTCRGREWKFEIYVDEEKAWAMIVQ